jgi:RNA polymerase sigma-70 factor (ECF subfamily)
VDHAPAADGISGFPKGDTGRSKASPTKPSTQADEARRREQFESLAMPLVDRLYVTALRLVREPARAEDMVQETYLRAWQNFDRFSIGTNFKAWIFQILTYLFLNDRRSANRRTVNVDFTEHDVIEAPAPADNAASEASTNAFDAQPSAIMDWERLYPSLVDDAMKRALDRLPSEQRAVLLLVTLAELSYQECAEILNVPIGTIMSRLFRARQQLQTELTDYAKERGMLPKE